MVHGARLGGGAIHQPLAGGSDVDQQAFTFRFFSLLVTWLHLAGAELEQAPVQPKILDSAEVEQIMRDFDRCNLDGRG
ncbi:MAG TPA: hypothetical protein VF174_01205 [Micromonosporaceae bacterium]